mmetsp:Transcript_101621/g.296260  ORF Transcript_101621/g.296260 Transcript_101621/m.296260 type:complete len:232 (+) Transcript_101621:335-1030(+)
MNRQQRQPGTLHRLREPLLHPTFRVAEVAAIRWALLAPLCHGQGLGQRVKPLQEGVREGSIHVTAACSRMRPLHVYQLLDCGKTVSVRWRRGLGRRRAGAGSGVRLHAGDREGLQHSCMSMGCRCRSWRAAAVGGKLAVCAGSQEQLHDFCTSMAGRQEGGRLAVLVPCVKVSAGVNNRADPRGIPGCSCFEKLRGALRTCSTQPSRCGRPGIKSPELFRLLTLLLIFVFG